MFFKNENFWADNPKFYAGEKKEARLILSFNGHKKTLCNSEIDQYPKMLEPLKKPW
jgi:hypothetical protein